MQLERVTDRGLGTEPPNYWAMFEILQHKNSNFNGILITFRTFWSGINDQIAKIQKSFQMLKLLNPFSPLPLTSGQI